MNDSARKSWDWDRGDRACWGWDYLQRGDDLGERGDEAARETSRLCCGSGNARADRDALHSEGASRGTFARDSAVASDDSKEPRRAPSIGGHHIRRGKGTGAQRSGGEGG